ncbi:MAG: hypothetical protein ACHQFW_05165 [Chitinophagales bacterium]
MQLTTILAIMNTTVFLAGGIFAGVQLRLMTKQKERDSAIQLLHSFQTPLFLEGVDIVFKLPEGLSKKEVETVLGEKMICILVLFGTFESLAILIVRKELDIKLVEDFFSGVILLSWKKFKNYIFEMREVGHRDTYYEWVQWLSEQLEKREAKVPSVPAYEMWKEWEG